LSSLTLSPQMRETMSQVILDAIICRESVGEKKEVKVASSCLMRPSLVYGESETNQSVVEWLSKRSVWKEEGK
jgi:hypothetical protein